MLESYVTPILMSYVNRYIKNLKPSDLQLSLWGGDVVLSKLELKLDVLEQELKLPFTFLSGHIHELRIHVPWTKLGSESVVITINTMECILKLKDGVQDDHESCGSSSTSRSNTESAKSPVKPRKIQQAAPTDPDLPPGYVQSLIRRVVNNVNIVVNNLILKYVEDDIVLSVNITCAECYTVDEFWDRAFMDISATELVLRKVINFSDCTVCLDKRNASGKIEIYQDPLLYKCSFRTRLHFTYDSLNSKMPAVIKIHAMVDSLKLSLTDQQLPMFIRILQLGIALYYGEIGNSKEEIEDPPGHTKDTVIHMPGSEEELAGVQYPTQEMYHMQDDDQQGWVSWAWSFVPAIVSYDNEMEGEDGYTGSEGGGVTQGHQSQQSKDPIVSIGFYCTKATVTFKLTEMQAESSYYSPQKVKSREVIRWEQEGTTIEVLMKGEPFFDCQVGFVGSQAICLKGIMGIKDFEENANRADSEACFFTCGESLSIKGNAYLTNSLFDYRSPENNGIRAEFILDSCSHKETYTEIAGMQRFGALYMDYLYTMECTSGKGSINQQDFQPTKPEENGSFQEMSIKRLVVGPIDLRFDSSSVHRIMKMVACSFDHEYEAYGSSRPVVQEECKTMPTPEEVASLEEYIPTRQTCVTLLKCTITITMAEFNLLGQLLPVILGQKHSSISLNATSFHPIRPLPAITIIADKINIEHSEPMYAEQLVQTVSSLIQPSDNLLHHCYAHCYLKVFGFQAGLAYLDNKGTCFPPVPVIPAFSTALYGKLLRLPQYWTKRTHVPVDEYIFELPNLTIQATRAQTLLLQVICQSWSYGTNSSGPSSLSEALLTEIFSGVKSKNALPTLEGSIQNVELKFCSTSLVKCVSGTLGSIKICAKAPGDNGKEKLIPLVQGPSDTKDLHRSKWLKESRKPESLLGPDLIAFTVQVPEQMDYCHSSGAVLLASVQGLALNVDPVLYTWLLYQPQRKGDRQPQQPLGSVPLAMPLSRKKEDEVSIGSTPLAKQASNQPSEYASSPVKTKTVTESRPLSVPAKMLQTSRDSSKTAEERMKEIIRLVWNAVKRLTLQVEIQTCCVFFPNDSLPSPSTIVSNDIAGTVRSWYHGQTSMPGTLVFCLPNIKIMSAGHKHIEPIQEIPFVVPRPIVEEGVAFPWTINLHNFSVYTLVEHQVILNLVEPMGCTSTLAVTSHALPSAGPEAGHSFVVCLHVDLEPLEIKCSNPQVQLLYQLTDTMSKVWEKVQKKGVLYQSSLYFDSSAGPTPSSPIRSSVGTAPQDTSTCSPSADIGTTTEADSIQAAESPFSDSVTLEQTTSNIGVSSGRVSLWMQWMLPKITIKLFAADPTCKGTKLCVVSELEDLNASVDVQDVYTKVKCKIESFNIDHYRSRPGESWQTGHFLGIILQCKEKNVTTAKLLESSHQQHGFLSLTYTKAVTRNVRHKLTTRSERTSRSFQKLSEGSTDSSPHFLHEILISAQAFDVVLFFPLLHAISTIFDVSRPQSKKEKHKSPGQPMRSHTLSSRNLPLIYINTSIIRVFVPKAEEKQQHLGVNQNIIEDTLVLKIASVSMAPQADNPLSRSVLRKDIYQRALNLGIIRDPGSEVEDRQYQIDLQSINIGTAQWEQLKPEKESNHGGLLVEADRGSQNPALEWNMASSIRRHQERRAILSPILTDFTVRVTAAPAIIFSKVSHDNLHTEDILVCGHSLEVNITTSLDFFLSVAQVQLLQQLLQANMVGFEQTSMDTEVCKQEQQKKDCTDGRTVDTSSRYSGAQDSGIGSDSVKIRIVQIEPQSGTSHHRIVRPSKQSSIVKNLNFIPFDIFITASRISLMSYSCTAVPKSKVDSKDNEKDGKSSLNQSTTESEETADRSVQSCISSLTAEDLFNSSSSTPANGKTGLLSLERLHASTRSSARQALGITIVRQPGRRGTGDLQLNPFLHLIVSQPSLLISCHHKKQKVEISLFDALLNGVDPEYKCSDAGKTLPEGLDYSKIWLQTAAGEVNARTGIPPPFVTLQIKDFLNGPVDINLEISRPLKVNFSFVKLDQLSVFLEKIMKSGSDHSPEGLVTTEEMLQMDETIKPTTSSHMMYPGTMAPDASKCNLHQEGTWRSMSFFHRITFQTTQLFLSLETVPHPKTPCILTYFSDLRGCLGSKAGNKTLDTISGAVFTMNLNDFVLKTSMNEKSRNLIGPVSGSVNLEASWCKHSGDPGPQPTVPKIVLDVRCGLLQVFWGQENLNCLQLLYELIQEYLKNKSGLGTTNCEQPLLPVSPMISRPSTCKTENSSDDLRTGLFQYIQDTDAQKIPNAFEVVFYNETEDNPGMMLWKYPEPRVLTLMRITPVPFNTTEDPDISTADLGDVLQIPCSLEYWDELQRSFVAFREFSLSESKPCELLLPSITTVSDQKELVASNLWRIVLNGVTNVMDDQSSESESGSQSACDQLVTPTALAACTRVDSCFTPWLVPSIGVSVHFAHLELHLCHHLDQLGSAPPKFLHPFVFDMSTPGDLEYMLIKLKEPHVYVRQWCGSSVCQDIRFSTDADCQLLECRNLTMKSLVKPFHIQGQTAISLSALEKCIDCTVLVDPVFVNLSQHSVHSINTAIQAWQQNRCPGAEELIYSHFVVCNDTQETLRFGQLDTDENILLFSLCSHQYCWRSHKSPQLLHICIEGWGNWRWSEPINVDNAGTFIRTIQYKGRTATLIIKVRQLNGVQKQVTICGKQIICSYLPESIDLKVVQQYMGHDGCAVVREQVDCLEAKQKLPSYILEDSELTELCVRAKGDEEWSRDVPLTSDASEDSFIIQVPSSNGPIIYVWCTLLTLEAGSQAQQRMIVFSPLFIMQSHLPDPIIIHLEKRSLGLRETQVIPGKGLEKPIQNIEPDITHHLTFQAREEDDPSECAVPISTALIKQIAMKAQSEHSAGQIISDFYGQGCSPQPVWPYNKKDTDSGEHLAQWDSPMRVKLSLWSPHLKTLLVELLPWALLINQSRWDLWLFEGEDIVLQIPAGKTIVPPNFKEAFQIGIYWANTNTVHKSVAVRLVHDVTSPKWKDGDNGEVVSLDEDGFVDANIKLGAFPGHQKLCQFSISSMVRNGIQILQIEDKTVLVNNTSMKIYYSPQMSVPQQHSEEEYVPVPDSTVFSIGPVGEHPVAKYNTIPCWDLVSDNSHSTGEPLPLQKYMLLSLCHNAAAGSPDCWSLPAIIRLEYPRQSVAVPLELCAGNDLCTKALVLTYQEHFGVTYITLTEDPSPRVIIRNRCTVSLLLKENIKETPKFEVYCRKIPAECSVHHEMYHQVSSFPDCKTRDSLPGIYLKVLSCEEESAVEWSDLIDINNQGTQVVFLTGFGYVYVDVVQHCGEILITLAPEGRAGPVLTSLNRTQCLRVVIKSFITQLSVGIYDDVTNYKASSELMRLTMDNVFLHLTPVTSYLRQPCQEMQTDLTTCGIPMFYSLEVYCGDLQIDNQLYSKSNFHFPVLICQEEKVEFTRWPKAGNLFLSIKELEEYKETSFCKLFVTSQDIWELNEVSFDLRPSRLYVEDTFVYYVKTLFDTYLPDNKLLESQVKYVGSKLPHILPDQVRQHAIALVSPVKLRRLTVQPVNVLVSIHASLKLYIASDHTPLAFSMFERGPIFTTARQLLHALVMHYAAGALFRAGWVVGSLDILGSPGSLVRSIGNGIADFFRLPYEGLTRGPGAFVSGVSRGTSSFVKHISKGTLTSLTNLATSLARNMDRLSLDEEHYNRQEEWRRQLPDSLGEGLRQGLSRLGISLLGAIAGIVDQPMQNFQRTSEAQASAGHKAKGVISGVGKGIVGVFTKPIGGAAELVSQTGYGILHGAGLSQLPKQRYPASDLQTQNAPNSHVKYVWKMLQSLGRPELHMALDVVIVSGSGQEYVGCLLLTSEVLFVVSISEDTQQQAFPVTEIDCMEDQSSENCLLVQLKQQPVSSELECDGTRERLSEQQYSRLVDYVAKSSPHLIPSQSSLHIAPSVVAAEPPPSNIKTYQFLVEAACARVFISKFKMVKNKALQRGFH